MFFSLCSFAILELFTQEPLSPKLSCLIPEVENLSKTLFRRLLFVSERKFIKYNRNLYCLPGDI